MDIVSTETRSRMMAGIRGKDTKPELRIRKALHAGGYRYRINQRKLPGTPDIVLKKYNAVIFVHGCFWHGHNCALFKLPKTRTEFWREKITANGKRDRESLTKLQSRGWRVCTVWECALRGSVSESWFGSLLDTIVSWLHSDQTTLEIDRVSIKRYISNHDEDDGSTLAAESPYRRL